jgi:phage tail sheath protein FI
LWDNNDEFLREEVSSRVSAFLSQIRVAGGLLNYKVTMNQDNNTPETITAGYGILDVEVEPAFPVRIFVTKITVHKAGGLSQTGFNV